MALITLSKDIVNEPHSLKVINSTFKTFELVDEVESGQIIYRINGKYPNIPFEDVPKEDVYITLNVVSKLDNKMYISGWNRV